MATAEANTHKNWNYLDHSAYVRSYQQTPQLINTREFQYKSSVFDAASEWNHPSEKAIWLPSAQVDKIVDFKVIVVKDIQVKIPISVAPYLETPIKQSMYLLELQDNWDGEQSKAYSIDSWIGAVHFTINFYEWISKIYSGKFYSPKIYHGPDGSIDIVWNEDNFRLFVNLDLANNKGSFYSDREKSQSTEGQIPSLNNVDFQLITPPIRL